VSEIGEPPADRQPSLWCRIRDLFSTRNTFLCLFRACLGGAILSLLLPCLLVTIHAGVDKFSLLEVLNGRKAPPNDYFVDALEFFTMVFVGAAIFCGPGGLVLTLILFAWLRKYCEGKRTEADFIRIAAIAGAFLALLNIPAYAVAGLVATYLHVLVLFLVSGASGGAWIGWQVYRSHHPNSPILPRYSLGMLMAFTVAWGALLALFMQPR
jgi:hypothetical protein